jgi:hypothetical protein
MSADEHIVIYEDVGWENGGVVDEYETVEVVDEYGGVGSNLGANSEWESTVPVIAELEASLRMSIDELDENTDNDEAIAKMLALQDQVCVHKCFLF